MNCDKEHLRTVFRDNIIKDNLKAFKLLMPSYIKANISFITGFKLSLDNNSFSIANFIYQSNIKEENYIRNNLLEEKINDLDLQSIKFMYKNKISIDNDSIVNGKTLTNCIIDDYTSSTFIRVFLHINKICKNHCESKELLKNLICCFRNTTLTHNEFMKIKLDEIFNYYTFKCKSEITEFLIEKLDYDTK